MGASVDHHGASVVPDAQGKNGNRFGTLRKAMFIQYDGFSMAGRACLSNNHVRVLC